MNNYKPPYSITDKMLELVSDISEKIGKVSGYKELETKPHLRRNNRIRSIHSSLSIEANSLSLSQVKDVIDGHLVIGTSKEIQEVKNAYEAYELMTTIDPTSVKDLKKLHGIMTKAIIDESGEYRRGEEGVFSGDKCIFIAPPPHMVKGLMDDLLKWLKKSEGNVHPLIRSAVFHYEFVFIHPFADGNGRMARLWHSAILYRWRKAFAYIPLESQIEKYQSEYYKAIAICHSAGDSNYFIEFMLEMIDQVLDETISQIIKSGENETVYIKKLLQVMEYDVPYTSNDILEALGLKSKETLRKNYINPALALGLIKMEYPDKPRSKNQRYIRV